jgi:hypothetical protein
VFAGKPDERYLSQYKHFTSEGLDVYVHPHLEVEPHGIEVSMDKWAFMKRLKVTGVKVAERS